MATLKAQEDTVINNMLALWQNPALPQTRWDIWFPNLCSVTEKKAQAPEPSTGRSGHGKTHSLWREHSCPHTPFSALPLILISALLLSLAQKVASTGRRKSGPPGGFRLCVERSLGFLLEPHKGVSRRVGTASKLTHSTVAVLRGSSQIEGRSEIYKGAWWYFMGHRIKLCLGVIHFLKLQLCELTSSLYQLSQMEPAFLIQQLKIPQTGNRPQKWTWPRAVAEVKVREDISNQHDSWSSPWLLIYSHQGHLPHQGYTKKENSGCRRMFTSCINQQSPLRKRLAHLEIGSSGSREGIKT